MRRAQCSFDPLCDTSFDRSICLSVQFSFALGGRARGVYKFVQRVWSAGEGVDCHRMFSLDLLRGSNHFHSAGGRGQ